MKQKSFKSNSNTEQYNKRHFNSNQNYSIINSVLSLHSISISRILMYIFSGFYELTKSYNTLLSIEII